MLTLNHNANPKP